MTTWTARRRVLMWGLVLAAACTGVVVRTIAQPKPESPRIRFETSAGSFTMITYPLEAPITVAHIVELVKAGFYDDVRFFRVLDGFMAQFGMSGTPSVQVIWGNQRLSDDPVKQSNKRGYITFANAGPNSRSTQVFINFADNTGLDTQNFAPFGQITEGMDVVDKLYSGYGRTNVPNQGRITTEGNVYLNKEYPKLDYVKKATIEP